MEGDEERNPLSWREVLRYDEGETPSQRPVAVDGNLAHLDVRRRVE
jgi:hypothetical protein